MDTKTFLSCVLNCFKCLHLGHKGYFQIIKEFLKEQRHENETVEYYPVHRLDALTSGTLLIAKSRMAAKEMGLAFSESRVDKYYVAISDRKPSKKQGTIKGDLQKARRGSYKLLRQCDNPSVTKFASVPLFSDKEHPGSRAFVLKPITGKTHQIRVAMKAIGSPIAGDGRYGSAVEAARSDRGYLHCAAIKIALFDETIRIVCPPDEGSRFIQDEFSCVFDGWFPKTCVDKNEKWFAGHPLLESRL
eukprot:jgi/Picsp_1/6424/NSC_03772-R1_pseudouridine synthase rlu family protein